MRTNNGIRFHNLIGDDEFIIEDESVILDLFEAKVWQAVMNPGSIELPTDGIVISVGIADDYINKYNEAHMAGCKTVRDIAEFELMRIRAGKEYSLGNND